MELTKLVWKKEDIKAFQTFLTLQGKGEQSANREQKIVNTNLPCLAVPSQTINNLISKIAQGNFISFLDLWIWQYHANTTIIGGLICRIDDFDLQKKYLDKYISYADNWATIDCLKFKFNNKNKQNYLEYAQQLSKSQYIFGRRLALILCLKLCNDDAFCNQIFDIANSFFEETEYYVNMANAWLCAELFIKHRQKTLEFLKKHNLNKFTINKMISKCRDSFRVTSQDKEFLLSYKQN